MTLKHCIFDTEIIGMKKPVFLLCCTIVETGEVFSFWGHKPKDVDRLEKMLERDDLQWIGFNSENFDRPLVAACLMGHDANDIKLLATNIVEGRLKSFQTYRDYGIEFFKYNHVDLWDVAPGVMISLKTYAGRLGYPTMVDMPYHHDTDLTPKQMKELEKYCINDLGVTRALWEDLQEALRLREALSMEYDIDLMSKSDAQIAEAIFKTTVGIKAGSRGQIPSFVEYRAPKFIKTNNNDINKLIDRLEETSFHLNRINGQVIAPAFLEPVLKVGKGTYQVGVGGLHSTHDLSFYMEATKDSLISDFDVTSYYPNIMMKAGLTPQLEFGKGQVFIDEYQKIYDRRMIAKDAGQKILSNSLKIMLNGTFGKLGSVYCCFYAPELLLAVTLTGQLNLLCLIHEIEKKGMRVLSANTDGIMVNYRPDQREALMKIIVTNSKRTGFNYEETPYSKVAIKDVNNYIAIKTPDKNGKVSAKRKGLYALSGVQEMKNPTMEVCGHMAVDYLIEGVKPEDSISRYKDIKDFVAIRNVGDGGGGIQHPRTITVDDWVEVYPGQWWKQSVLDEHGIGFCAPVRRKSRPKPYEKGVDGKPFGRVARWYMTTKKLPAITGVKSGSKVAKTEGGMLCLTLPDKLPADLDYQWYINETYAHLTDMGVKIT